MKKKMLFWSFFLVINSFFIDIVSAETYNNFKESYTSCGNGYLNQIPILLPRVISILYILIEIAVPVALVVFGMIDLFKSITAQKEEEMKKGRQMLIKRAIYAAIIFFVFLLVRIVISYAANNNKVLDCAECFIKNVCDK